MLPSVFRVAVRRIGFRFCVRFSGKRLDIT